MYGSSAVEFKMQNDRDLVFAAVYQKSLQKDLKYVGALIGAIRKAFVDKFGDTLSGNPMQDFDFDADFNKIRKAIETANRQNVSAETKPKKVMRSFEETQKFKKTLQHNEEFQSGTLEANQEVRKQERQEKEETAAERIARRQAELRSKKSSPTKGKASVPHRKAKKRVESTKPAKEVLDYCDDKPPDNDAGDDEPVEAIDGTELLDLYQEEVTVPDAAKSASGLFSYFTTLTGGNTITAESIAPALEKMRLHLISKNVAADIAEQICDGVGKSLVGQPKGTFSKIATIVKQSIETTLTSILSPKRRVDILRDIIAARKEARPYVIVFCGVNGVGKSTNLSKICYWLLQNENSVCIAACDTFRAGAVEQLKTHCRKLTAHQQQSGKKAKVLLFERGYQKDAAGVAADAIAFSKDEGYDVVLVDTAGRMQDNEPLMRALAKLVTHNSPDLTLFVGEALVGNESVDQLSKFNQSLADHSGSADGKGVDGIVLTKFDTVDDKVGAAISMTYITGQPIVFVGTGQTYGDLKKLNVKSVVQALLN